MQPEHVRLSLNAARACESESKSEECSLEAAWSITTCGGGGGRVWNQRKRRALSFTLGASLLSGVPGGGDLSLPLQTHLEPHGGAALLHGLHGVFDLFGRNESLNGRERQRERVRKMKSFDRFDRRCLLRLSLSLFSLSEQTNTPDAAAPAATR